MKSFIDSDKSEPEKITVIEKVTSFELKTRNSDTTLYYCKDSAIYETPLVYGSPIEDGKISTRELERLDHAVLTYHANDGKILFADKSENVYLISNNEEG